jgi:putative transposase
MHAISRDAPCYYLTSVAKKRLPVFRADEIRVVTCSALNEARTSGRFALYAYVIMPDHLHVITDSSLAPAKTLQFINGITAHRIIQYLKSNEYHSSLEKLQHAVGLRKHKYSLWDHHPDARLLLTESMLMQRVTYTHQNPVRAGLVHQPLDYRWSSVRCWNGKMREDEPLLMDIDRIKWRTTQGRRMRLWRST